MIGSAEERVSRFYNSIGWETDGDVTEDARRWEDLRERASAYVSQCRLRVLRHIPPSGENILDMASGPIQYREYLEFSKRFDRRYCVDLSANALEQAKRRIGDHGVFLHGSFFDLELEDDFFDCAVSLHTIYHMDKDRQEEAVRKLMRVTKPGRPVIIVYGNPRTLVRRLRSSFPFRVLMKLRRLTERSPARQSPAIASTADEQSLYFHLHPLEWWSRFRDVADVDMYPWRSFDAETQKALLPDNRIGARLFGILFRLEERFPNAFVRHFEYPLIVITRKA